MLRIDSVASTGNAKVGENEKMVQESAPTKFQMAARQRIYQEVDGKLFKLMWRLRYETERTLGSYRSSLDCRSFWNLLNDQIHGMAAKCSIEQEI